MMKWSVIPSTLSGIQYSRINIAVVYTMAMIYKMMINIKPNSSNADSEDRIDVTCIDVSIVYIPYTRDVDNDDKQIIDIRAMIGVSKF